MRKSGILLTALCAVLFAAAIDPARAAAKVERVTVMDHGGYFPVAIRLSSGEILAVMRAGAPHIGRGGRLVLSISNDARSRSSSSSPRKARRPCHSCAPRWFTARIRAGAGRPWSRPQRISCCSGCTSSGGGAISGRCSRTPSMPRPAGASRGSSTGRSTRSISCAMARAAWRWHSESFSFQPTAYTNYAVPTKAGWGLPHDPVPVGDDPPDDAYALVPITLDWQKIGGVAYSNQATGVKVTHYPVIHCRSP